jgi:Uma2 family endonuclease
MTTATPIPSVAGPQALRWTVPEFHRMIELGFFPHRAMLIRGELLETHHGVPIDPDPRPFRMTREQYYRLGDLGFFRNRRVELIRGEVLLMSPMNEPHVTGTALTADRLRDVFGTGFFIRTQAPLDLGADMDPEPDVAVVPGGPRDYSATPTMALLIVGVADTSLSYDTTTKAELYAEKSIPEYWVLDLANRRLLVFRDPAPIAAGGAAYRTLLTLSPSESVSPLAVPAAAVAVADLLP